MYIIAYDLVFVHRKIACFLAIKTQYRSDIKAVPSTRHLVTPRDTVPPFDYFTIHITVPCSDWSTVVNLSVLPKAVWPLNLRPPRDFVVPDFPSSGVTNPEPLVLFPPLDDRRHRGWRRRRWRCLLHHATGLTPRRLSGEELRSSGVGGGGQGVAPLGFAFHWRPICF